MKLFKFSLIVLLGTVTGARADQDSEAALSNRIMGELQSNIRCEMTTLRLTRELQAAQQELAALKAKAEPKPEQAKK